MRGRAMESCVPNNKLKKIEFDCATAHSNQFIIFLSSFLHEFQPSRTRAIEKSGQDVQQVVYILRHGEADDNALPVC